jgi:hypothetical protein
MNNNALRHTLWNLTFLVIGVLGIQLFSFLFYYFVEKPSNHGYSDVGVPANMLDGVGSLFIDFVLMAMFIIYWSIKVIKDILSFRNNRLYFLVNIFILLFPYTPVIYWSFKKCSFEIIDCFHRKDIISKIEIYETIKLPKGSTCVAFEESKDNLVLYTLNPKKVPDYLPPKQLIINPNSPLERQLYFHSLEVYSLVDINLNQLSNVKLDTFSNSLNILVLKTRLPNKDCNVYKGDIENRRLIIENACILKKDTISGFKVFDRSNSPFRGYKFNIDSENKYWFLFYTEPRTEEVKDLYIGMIDSFTSKIYQIPLKKEDKKIFDSDNIITLYKKGNTFYIISADRILYFNFRPEEMDNRA